MALPPALHYQSRTMQQKLVLLLVLTLSAWSPVFSAADTPETRRKEAERYLQVSPPKALFEDMADKMAANLPADQRDQFKKLMTTQVDIAALSKAMIDAMVKNFTTEELKALADDSTYVARRPELLYYLGRSYYAASQFTKAVDTLERYIRSQTVLGRDILPAAM